MPSEDPVDRGHRLHPASLLFTLGNTARNLLIPGLAVLFLARGHRADLWIMALFLPSVLYHLVRYFTLTYSFARTELVVRQGVIFRQERHIPYDRIDNVNLVQGPLHRLLRSKERRPP